MLEPTPDSRPRLRVRLQRLIARAQERLAARRPDWRRTRHAALEVLKTLLIAFLLAQLIMVSVARAFQVEQSSMEPSLLPRDRVLVNKFIYRLREPARGDVVVLRYPRNPEKNYIKRVIGLPGEKLEIKKGKLYVNGRLIKEQYLNGDIIGDYGPARVPPHAVFVMGDNRNNSEDSRAFGPLEKELIVGQAILIYWPPQRARLLPGP